MSITRIGDYAQAKGVPYKIPCRVASTANIASLSGLLTVDGVTVSAGDRVLVWQQNTAAENNIYVAASGAWTTAIDMSLADDLFIGMEVYVYAGTTYGKRWFVATATSPITFEEVLLTEVITFEYKDITKGTAQTYTLDPKAAFGYKIISASMEVDNGTLTGVAIKINTTAVTSLSNVTVDTGIDTTNATAANTVVAGDRVTLVTSTGYTGTPTKLIGNITRTRT